MHKGGKPTTLLPKRNSPIGGNLNGGVPRFHKKPNTKTVISNVYITASIEPNERENYCVTATIANNKCKFILMHDNITQQHVI